MCQNILSSTLKNATFSVIFEVLVKAITFLLNAFSVRYISKDLIGIINIRLQLLESTILFLSREAFRKAAFSQVVSYSWHQVINLTWLTVPTSVIVSILFGYIWLYLLENPSSEIAPYYALGVWSVGIGCIIEMFAEPLYIVSQAYSFITLKVVLATMIVVIRAFIFVFWTVLKPKNAILAYSFAHLVSSLAYVISYYSFYYMYIWRHCIKQRKKTSHFSKDNNSMLQKPETCKTKHIHELEEKNQNEFFKDLNKSNKLILNESSFPFSSLMDFFPKPMNYKNWIHSNSAVLTWSFFKQGILKQILTEGERYIMTLFSVMSFREQGIYDIVNNLGSLVVRFIFKPIEESLYFYFAQSIKRDKNFKNQNQKIIQEISTVLQQCLHCFVAIGVLIFIFSLSYSELLLYLYGGTDLSTGIGPLLLKAKSFSVLLLGINGITECFVFSTMTPLQLNKHNYLMAGFSLMFLMFSWILSQLLGSIGFIIANCCNMSARIFHSLFFISNKYFGTSYKPLSGLFLTKYFSASLFAALIFTKITEKYCNYTQHFLLGIMSLIIILAIWGLEKKELVIFAIKNYKNKNT